PAQAAGIRAGDRLVAVDGIDTASAVAAFWADLGASGGGERDGHAARLLASGRRDRVRHIIVQRGTGQTGAAKPRSLRLPSLYSLPSAGRPPVTVETVRGEHRIRFNDSLGDTATIAAFDSAMAAAPRDRRLVIDLTDTPGGGNTTVARAVMGWFVTRPTFYQMHRLPAEERRFGVARQWVEQVLPRAGKYHRGPVTVRVGRWTASMGEGLAIGFDAIGARVEGSRMAGLLGAVHDHRLERSGQLLKLPTERLYSVGGLPREDFVPKRQID
ncbi:MAG TPA: S41 family peptidase, partial [Sphingomicrobium sp.]|nr:S41 family peptidase [Sphingomicrobium sp.]